VTGRPMMQYMWCDVLNSEVMEMNVYILDQKEVDMYDSNDEEQVYLLFKSFRQRFGFSSCNRVDTEIRHPDGFVIGHYAKRV